MCVLQAQPLPDLIPVECNFTLRVHGYFSISQNHVLLADECTDNPTAATTMHWREFVQRAGLSGAAEHRFYIIVKTQVCILKCVLMDPG